MIVRIFLRLLLGAALAFGALMVVLYALSFLANPSTYFVLRAESETARFDVANAQQSTFAIDGLRVFGDGDFDGACAAEAFGRGWALEPQLGATVEYTVLRDKRLLIELTAPAEGAEAAILRGPGPNRRPQVRSIQDDLVLRDDPECGERSAYRLPIWGPGEIGGEPTFRGDGPAPTLLSGAVQMHGRASTHQFDPLQLIGLADSDAARMLAAEDQTIYPSPGMFEIPPGSRVSTLLGDADPSLKALRGFAIQEDGARSLRVDASTEAPEVFFYPPGAGKKADRMRMSLLSQIANDPNLNRMVQIIVWFVVVLPIALELIRPIFARDGEDW